VELWGEDLVIRLDEVYRKKARYCVVFVSQHYRDKAWTTHELKSALARALEARGPYILPARFDDTEIPGVRPTVHYIDLRSIEPEVFAARILNKIGEQLKAPAATDPPTFRVPRVARKAFNPYEEAQRLIEHLATGFETRCAALADRGASLSRFDRDGRTCMRVVLNGKTHYALDVWMGGMSGDSSLAFAFSHGDPGHFGGGMNAWGDTAWSTVKDEPVIKMFNLSLVGRMGQEVELSYGQLLDELWDDVCAALEAEQW
ncbi:MAG: TIR domain-containing protein, partial [Acidimicrobiia bacterium]|nr:TIR domain-containing protein [Acidimicrobiia bacterium]